MHRALKRDLNIEYEASECANNKISAVVRLMDCDESGDIREWRSCYRQLLGAPCHPGYERREIIMRMAFFALDRL